MPTEEKRERLQLKLDTLRDAVLNPTAPLPPAESLHQMFLSWADYFTVWHLRILAFFDDPKGWFAARGRRLPSFLTCSLGTILTEAYPELKDERPFYDLIAKELWDTGLMNTDGLHAMMSTNGASASRTTDLGKQFLRFMTGSKASM